MLIVDVECLRDYFLLASRNTVTGEVLRFEMFEGHPLDVAGVSRLMLENLTGSFNGLGYDLPIIACALRGFSCAQLKAVSDRIIKTRAPGWMALGEVGVSVPPGWDHIDVMPVLPGKVSLKIYGGRLHAPLLQSFPVDFDAPLPPSARAGLREYCVNDLETTEMAFRCVSAQIKLRMAMSKQYGIDLRSRGDAQIAEAVLLHELGKVGTKPAPAPASFRLRPVDFIAFETEELRAVSREVFRSEFGYGASGNVLIPPSLASMDISFAGRKYKLGIGGLHSMEKSQTVRAGDDLLLGDLDVSSFYPSIMLGQRLFPPSLGREFLRLFRSIVDRRIAAKRSGNKVEAETLKIVINSTYGLLGSKYSALYAPHLLIQTTLSGQLALLMLIESMELAGVSVVSANTDGIVCLLPRSLERKMEEVAWGWELSTGFNLERADYAVVASRDVNNYLAVKTDGSVKRKGCFTPTSVAKNPDCEIVADAVVAFVAQGVPLEKTIGACRDIRKFLMLRTVTGGAIWRDQELGKAVRYYYSKCVASCEGIRYVVNENLVPKSSGARPLMNLPDEFPGDVDLVPYQVAAEKLLCEVAFL